MKRFALVFTLLAVMVAGTAQARWVNVLPPVTKADVEMMKAAAREGMDGQPEGTVNTWANPESRNSGEVTLVRRFEEDGNECRILRHVVNVVRYSPWEQSTKICRNSSGEWEMRPLNEPAAE